MDLIREVVSTPYAFPAGIVALVISCAVLVFVFGFKSAEEPPFDQLSLTSDDRKPAGKKRKLKDKKSQSNGHATLVKEKTKTSSDGESGKVAKQSPKQQQQLPKEQPKKKEPQQPTANKLKEKKQDNGLNRKTGITISKPSTPKKAGKGKENLDVSKKTKKQEKIEDDDGWEQVGKKNRKNSPQTVDLSQEERDKSATSTPAKEKKIKKIVEHNSPKQESTPSTPAKEKTPAPVVKIESTTFAQKETDTPKKEKDSPKKEAKKSPEKKSEEKNVDSSTVNVKTEEKIIKKETNVVSATKSETEKAKPKKDVEKNEVFDQKTEGAVFDELGDVWTEKVPKKSKKKVRKE